MSGATFDTDTLRLMTLFENITHASLKDCVSDEEGKCIYFVVQEGKAGAAIGKNGSNVKHVESVIKKDVKIFEFSKDLSKFVKNLIPQANDVSVKNENGETKVEIKVDRSNKAIIIGRDGKNIKIFKELLQRNHNVNNLLIR
jgi:N utilization substance protein A